MGPTPAFTSAGLPVREFFLVLLVSAAVTFLLTGLVRQLAFRVGAVAYPRKRDVHAQPKPRMGGVAMFGGVLSGMFLALHLPVLRNSFTISSEVIGVAIAGAVIVVVGALDDRFELDSLTKLAGQVTSAGLLVLFGVQWYLFWVPWGGSAESKGQLIILDMDQGALFTVLLAVTMINALNMVDGLDGLAAGIGMIAALATCAFTMVLIAGKGGNANAYPAALMAATLAGSCIGFLPHNFQPSRIFMGDSGSMLIGLVLAAASTSASGQLNFASYGGKSTLALLSPLLVVAAVLFVPLLDLVMAVLRRTRAGRSPFAPDKMHLHHRLLEIGHSQRRAVLLIYLWASVLAFGAVSLTVFDVGTVIWVVGVGLLLALLASAVPRLRESRRS
ncbi:undecaprenyl/decaprenyl-phosphate alpha-N-acetylglucosaminyl 1-phosphate transferase [Allokutzneria sp. A3M-2-11 16]|uniref:glycosyltransferase family 4 protein n=1 Tax=Allokutzneria sp. A3M-2-11 16 TaxID=2962043 RepID=UPI0020B655AA|nr:MraY family glycosyltransferase [Allokutzneria sp. A3M-2-11 16]MCP3798267.1 undecaprenyl/decaprenyl-phosphate alpha-N-acetylglucosaminyl 1-phosphate transferase [Allokutzneria sp. A3M-2-11 16]